MPKRSSQYLVVFLAIILVIPLTSAARLGDPNSYVEALVRQSFADAPEMVDIARCESGIRQYNSDGSVLKGGAGKKYVGIFQIDPQIHTTAAGNLGFDIN